jgi:hypothetical protein
MGAEAVSDFVPDGYLPLQEVINLVIQGISPDECMLIRSVHEDEELSGPYHSIPHDLQNNREFPAFLSEPFTLRSKYAGEVQSRFKNALLSGTLAAYYFSNSGIRQVAPHVWFGEGADRVLETGIYYLPNLDGVSGIEDSAKMLYVQEDQAAPFLVGRLLTIHRARFRVQPFSEVDEVGEEESFRGAPGRAKNYDWEAAFIEMARILIIEDEWIDRAGMTPRIRAWFFEHYGKFPKSARLRSKIKQFYEGIWPPKT